MNIHDTACAQAPPWTSGAQLLPLAGTAPLSVSDSQAGGAKEAGDLSCHTASPDLALACMLNGVCTHVHVHWA